MSQSLDPQLYGEVTTREWEVVDLLMRGGRVSTIARDLGIQPVTVRNHLASIFSKVGVHSQAELVARIQELRGPARSPDPDTDSLRQTIETSNRQLLDAVAEALKDDDPLPRLKRACRDYLPLDSHSRSAWAARLIYWGVTSQQPEPPPDAPIRSAVEEGRRLAQTSVARGHLRQELDPSDVVDDFVRHIFATGVRLLMDSAPEAQARELAEIDALLERLRRSA